MNGLRVVDGVVAHTDDGPAHDDQIGGGRFGILELADMQPVDQWLSAGVGGLREVIDYCRPAPGGGPNGVEYGDAAGHHDQAL